jgi:hypothetical protein
MAASSSTSLVRTQVSTSSLLFIIVAVKNTCRRAAEKLELPFVPPFLTHNGSFRRGANFAVAGATTLDADFFHDRNIPGAPSKFPLNTSLNVQLEWFEKLKPSLCGSTQG